MFNDFFVSTRGCASYPSVVVTAVQSKLEEQLERYGLGPPTAQRTVAQVVEHVLAFNGTLMIGAFFDAIEKAVDMVHRTVVENERANGCESPGGRSSTCDSDVEGSERFSETEAK